MDTAKLAILVPGSNANTRYFERYKLGWVTAVHLNEAKAIARALTPWFKSKDDFTGGTVLSSYLPTREQPGKAHGW